MAEKADWQNIIQNSQVVSVSWEERDDNNLVSYLGHGQDRNIGYLKPGREDLTPVVLVITEVENELKLVGWDWFFLYFNIAFFSNKDVDGTQLIVNNCSEKCLHIVLHK